MDGKMYYEMRRKFFAECLSAAAAFLLVCGMAFFVFVEWPVGPLVAAGCFSVLGIGAYIFKK